MKPSVCEPRPARRGLLSIGAGLLALALAACSQNAEPEELIDLTAPVLAPAAPEKTTEKKPAPPVRRPAAPARPAATYPPVGVSSPFVPSAPGKRISRVNVPGPYVAVTFDDGPSAALTPQVLDIFKRHGAHATFFVQGMNASRNRSLLARMAAEGHEIGSHTWNHINMRSSSEATIISQLDRTAAVIEEATGSRPRVMRPPYGAASANTISMVYNRYGTPAILWDVDTNDWRKPGVETVIHRAVGNAKPGSIILLHDIHASTIAAVEGIVTGLQARGFKLVTVSQLISMGRHAAGAAAPARETAAPAPEAAPAAPAETPAAPESAPAPEEQPPAASGVAQQQQPMPEGSAAIGAAPVLQPVETTPEEQPQLQATPAPFFPSTLPLNYE